MPNLNIRSSKLFQLYISYLSITFGGTGLKFSEKMDPPIRMGTFNNMKHRHTIYLKSGDTFFTFLKKLWLHRKASICSTIIENVLVVIFLHLLSLP